MRPSEILRPLGILAATLLLPIVLFLASCAKKSSTATFSNALAVAMGVVGLSSPTAQADSALATAMSSRRWFSLPWAALLFDPYLSVIPPARAAADSLPILRTVKSQISTQLNQTTLQGCLSGILSFTSFTPTLSTCFGSVLTYQNHPDGADGAACAVPPSAFPCFPYGEVGIWSSAETTGEACGTSVVNTNVQFGATIMNAALKTIAGILCSANALKQPLPAIGSGGLDLTEVVNQFVSGAAFTNVSLNQLNARAKAISTWQVRITGTLSGDPIGINLLHSPRNTENTEFAGHLFGVIGSAGINTAFSMSYEQTATNLTMMSKFGNPTATPNSLFDVNNELNFNDASLAGQSGYYTLSSVDPNTGLGTVYVAWMNSTTDSFSRVFQTKTISGLAADSGVIYYGFGTALTAGSGYGTIEKMLCNITGPGANLAGVANKAESQHLTRDSSGLFFPDQSDITFVPTNSCSYTPGTMTLSAFPAVPAALGIVNHNFANFDSTTGVGDRGNIPLLSEPTY